jgi:hypothetical protein
VSDLTKFLLVRRSAEGDCVSGDVKTLVFKVIGHGSTIQAGPMGSSCVVVAGTDSSLAGRALRMVVLLAPAANSKRQN